MDLSHQDLDISLADLGAAPSQPLGSQPPSNTYSPGVTSAIEEKALKLLGSGVGQESVASALGVTPGRITQLLSNEVFAGEVAKLRYDSLQKHNQRDGKYDSLEDKLLQKLENNLPLLNKPTDILKAITVINGAKRRGCDSPEQASASTNIVNLTLPNVIAQKFVVNVHNQVTKAGDQSLHTMASGNLLKQVEEQQALIAAKFNEGVTHEPTEDT